MRNIGYYSIQAFECSDANCTLLSLSLRPRCDRVIELATATQNSSTKWDHKSVATKIWNVSQGLASGESSKVLHYTFCFSFIHFHICISFWDLSL
jgi:hypothetical protein